MVSNKELLGLFKQNCATHSLESPLIFPIRIPILELGQKSNGFNIKSEKEANHIIFDGNKTNTFNALKKVILKKI